MTAWAKGDSPTCLHIGNIVANVHEDQLPQLTARAPVRPKIFLSTTPTPPEMCYIMILAVMHSCTGSMAPPSFAQRLTASGHLDSGFGKGGHLQTQQGGLAETQLHPF